MARIDKANSTIGGFRAKLAGAWTGSATPKGVGLDANGRVVAGAGNTGIVGVVCSPSSKAAGDPIDVMQFGELVEFSGVAGTNYYAAAADGTISTTAPGAGANLTKVGYTVEATRLVVRVQVTQG